MTSRPQLDSPAASSPYAPPAPPPPRDPSTRGAPSSAIAFFLSFFAAGVGQFYLGRIRAAIGWLSLATIGTVLINAFFPGLSRAGAFGVAAVIYVLLLLARVLSAVDTLRHSKIPANRPSTPAVVVAFFVALALMTTASLASRAYLVEAFKIPSGSMMPTLLIGDHVFVDKKVSTFQRGHLLVFAYPENTQQDFVKRVIGVGGDRISMRDGELFINDWPVPHCKVGHGTLSQSRGEDATQGMVFVEFLGDQTYLTIRSDNTLTAVDGAWTVKTGEAFVLGDNRNNSHDSRMWWGGNGGGVPPENSKGEPFVIWMSVGDDGIDTSRIGLSTSAPTLPASLRALAPALATCLAARPPLTATTPPP